MLDLLKNSLTSKLLDKKKDLELADGNERVLQEIFMQLNKPYKSALDHNAMVLKAVSQLKADEKIAGKFLKWVDGIKRQRNAPLKERLKKEKEQQE